MAFHVGNYALQLADKLTIYTNGDDVITAKIRGALAKGDSRITLETRKIARLSMKSPDASDVIVTFEDGSTMTEGFIVSPHLLSLVYGRVLTQLPQAHAPTVEINGPFVGQLSLDLTPTGEIKTAPPFNQTSLAGVFACGDAATMIRAVPQAANMGSMAAAGIAAQIEAERWDGQRSV